jgi:hypothetical protein
MNQPPYNPFALLSFQDDKCFLTGKDLAENEVHFIPVFPQWLIARYHLEEATMAMLEWNRMKYTDMKLPASLAVANAIQQLDATTQAAFEAGYDAVKKLPELVLFQWMARIMYGVLYQDFTYSMRRHATAGTPLKVSPLMQQKLKNLLFMLQSLVRPIAFDGFTPWSMQCHKVNVSKDVFNYKDETHKLNFCLGMNGFGLVACLQDHGNVAAFNQDVLTTIADKTLHPAQFEELYARFMYTNYLLREFPDYLLTEEDDGTLLFSLPDFLQKDQPLFAPWKDEIYAQVLANMWEPWGIPIKQIYSFPNSPISYLIDENTHQFIRPETIRLDF